MPLPRTLPFLAPHISLPDLYSFHMTSSLSNSKFWLKNPKFRLSDKLFSMNLIVYLHISTWKSNRYSQLTCTNSIIYISSADLFISLMVLPSSANGNSILLIIQAPIHGVLFHSSLSLKSHIHFIIKSVVSALKIYSAYNSLIFSNTMLVFHLD